MKASILDLRYKMKDVLKALERNETVEILYHGQKKGELSPYRTPCHKKVSEHPFFGSGKDKEDVKEHINKLRGGRFNDL